MSNCHSCGAEIRWAKRSADKWMPPLEASGLQAFVIDEDNIARNRATYVLHRCDPEAVRQWEEHIDRLNDEQVASEAVVPTKEIITPEGEARRVTSVELYEIAMRRPCPKCYAEVGEYCLNQNDVSNGMKSPRKTVWPHPMRTQ